EGTMTRYLLISAGIVTALVWSASYADSATVTLTIAKDPAAVGCTGCTLSGAGTYQLFAQVSQGDNYGISAFSIPVLGVSSILNRAPRAIIADDDGFPAGFTLARSANNQVVIPGGFLLGGAQDSATPTPWLIRGFGQTAGSFITDPIIAGKPLGAPITQ